jgi:hypothetical protein
MKRTLLLGACMFVLGCDGSADEGGPATSSPMDLTTTEDLSGVDPRGDWGVVAPAAVSVARTAPAALRDLQVREEQAVVVNISSTFDPESIKSAEAFRMRMGVQR